MLQNKSLISPKTAKIIWVTLDGAMHICIAPYKLTSAGNH